MYQQRAPCTCTPLQGLFSAISPIQADRANLWGIQQRREQLHFIRRKKRVSDALQYKCSSDSDSLGQVCLSLYVLLY